MRIENAENIGRAFVISVLFAAAYGIASFAVTRGGDGSVVAFWISFGVIAACYWMTIAVLRHRVGIGEVLLHCISFEVACIAGYSLDARLEEMAAVLYVWIPVAVFLTVVIGLGVVVLGRICGA